MSKRQKRGISGKKHKGRGGKQGEGTDVSGECKKLSDTESQSKDPCKSSGQNTKGCDQEQVSTPYSDRNSEKKGAGLEPSDGCSTLVATDQTHVTQATLKSDSACTAPDVTGDQTSGTQVEYFGNSEHECTDIQLLAKRIFHEFDLSDEWKCTECACECSTPVATDQTHVTQATLKSDSACTAPDVTGDQTSGTQVEYLGNSEHKCTDNQLPAKRIFHEFDLNDVWKCTECARDCSLQNEIIQTHPQGESYAQKLKEQHSAHAGKCGEKELEMYEELPLRAAESEQKLNNELSQKHSNQYVSSAENEASSSQPLVQSSCDSATDNLTQDCVKSDDTMDISGSVEREGSSRHSQQSDGTYYSEESQQDNGGRSGGQQMNRRNKSNHGKGRIGSYNKKGSQGGNGRDWRKPDNRSHHQNADDRGARGGSIRRDRTGYKIVREVDGDLFEAPKEYSLAHCVAADMRMGSGIAVSFRQNFKRVPELLQQRARVGRIAVLEHEGRFIYYLVTKNCSNEKPYFGDLISSLEKLRDHCAEHSVKLLAMPRIGCGLDRLEWRRVKPEIERIFSGLDISIAVYNFNQPEKDDDSHYPRSKRPLPVKHVRHRLVDIERATALIFFGSEDGCVDECMEHLDHKFNFLLEYRKQRKSVGDAIRFVKKGEVLYGLIVRKGKDDCFSYIHFEKCLIELRKLVKDDDLWFIGVEAFCAENDPVTMEKVITVMINVLANRDLELYVCWPKDLEHYHRWDEEMRSLDSHNLGKH